MSSIDTELPAVRFDAIEDAMLRVIEGMRQRHISDDSIRALLTCATRRYVERLQEGCRFAPFDPAAEITATEAMILATEVLKAADLQLFELGMWQAMGSPT